MNYIKLKLDNDEFVFIGKYKINSEDIYKFANQDKKIYCKNEAGKYIPIRDKSKIKEIDEFFKADTDVIF